MTSNKKRTEEIAVNSINAAILKCSYLEAYLTSNDRTPSWDGEVFVYNTEIPKKDFFIGKVPVQIKGTEKKIKSDETSFSCKVADLKNYYRDGGCIFFLASVDLVNVAAEIYYANLHVFDLKKILDNAGTKNTTTIKLYKFPKDKPNEMASIFVSFIENARKQTSFIDKEIPSIEQLKSSGLEIESFSFCAPGVGLNADNIARFISTRELYIYAKPKGLDIEIPIDKVNNATIKKTVLGKVLVKGRKFFQSYSIFYENGEPIIQIGKGIRIVLNQEEKTLKISYKAIGTLNEVILDIECLVNIIENNEISLNGAKLEFNEIIGIDVEKYRGSLQYFKDVKRMLDMLGVKEELDREALTDQDENNIKNFVNDVIYNQGIGFPDTSDERVIGAFVIANLSIWIWATKQENGYYKIENFFSPHEMILFEEDDVEKKRPIPVSHYLLLNKEAFKHTSNIDYEAVKNELCAMEHRPPIIGYMTYLMLDVLHAFDEQEAKEIQLLDLAEAICEWLKVDCDTGDYLISQLNHLQICKRKRQLTTKEIIELGKLTDITNPANVRCGAFLLLDDSAEAQKCLNELSQEQQKEFLKFPICHFGKLY